MKYLLLAAFMLCNINPTAHAQGSKPPRNAIVIEETKTVEVAPKKAAKPAANYPAPDYTAPTVTPPATTARPAPAPVASNTAVAAPAEPVKSPWRMVYFGEYVGPRLSNIDLSKTQGPEDAVNDYTGFDHSLKVAYQVAKSHVLGTQIRAGSLFDPTATNSFFLKDLRFYGNWRNMVDTSDLNMGSELVLELPTSDKSRQATKLFALNLKLNWELKTQFRNWSFSAMTMIRTIFTDRVSNQMDLYLGLFPWVTMDLAPDWQLVFEGSFDASHSYNEAIFNYTSADPDFMNIGVMYSFSPHFQINPAFRFYTGNISFKAAVLYTSFTAAL